MAKEKVRKHKKKTPVIGVFNSMGACTDDMESISKRQRWHDSVADRLHEEHERLIARLRASFNKSK